MVTIKKTILSATAISSMLLLTGCVSIFGEKTVGESYDHTTAAAAALADPVAADIVTVAAADTPAEQGASYKLGFKASDAKYYANKDLTAGVTGADFEAKQTAIAKGTSLIKNGTKWDRIQDHAVTVATLVDADAGISKLVSKGSDLKPEDLHINKAEVSFKGNLANATTGHTFAELVETITNQAYNEDDLKELVPSGQGISANIGELSDSFNPEKDYEPNLFGVYARGDQYTAFYAASDKISTETQIADVSGANGYTGSSYNLDFRGIAKDAGANKLLLGSGTAAINFKTGVFSSKIGVTQKSDGATYGEINFSGTAAANKSFMEASTATFTPNGSATNINGYAEIGVYGEQAKTILGTTDFAYNESSMVGAFGSKLPVAAE